MRDIGEMSILEFLITNKVGLKPGLNLLKTKASKPWIKTLYTVSDIIGL